ncbi:MAG: LPP20 family lipoprotein [Gammaproteobacteria bacterium]|nr:LPP20 family lipoprotein [Gammaproteobacteria bacterium]
MKKLIALSLLLGVAVTLAGCGGKPVREADIEPDCVFPNTKEAAPGWVCDEPVAGLEVQAVGVAEATNAGISFQKDMAAADARGRLAEQFKTRVEKMVKKYLGTTGVGVTETVDAAASSTLKTITDQTLQGSKVYKSRTAPDGRLFVLMGLDAAMAERNAASALKTSMGNDQALWQQFQAKKSFDELAAEISKTAP